MPGREDGQGRGGRRSREGGGLLAREEGQGWKKAREEGQGQTGPWREGCLGARETGERRARETGARISC